MFVCAGRGGGEGTMFNGGETFSEGGGGGTIVVGPALYETLTYIYIRGYI